MTQKRREMVNLQRVLPDKSTRKEKRATRKKAFEMNKDDDCSNNYQHCSSGNGNNEDRRLLASPLAMLVAAMGAAQVAMIAEVLLIKAEEVLQMQMHPQV